MAALCLSSYLFANVKMFGCKRSPFSSLTAPQLAANVSVGSASWVTCCSRSSELVVRSFKIVHKFLKLTAFTFCRKSVATCRKAFLAAFPSSLIVTSYWGSLVKLTYVGTNEYTRLDLLRIQAWKFLTQEWECRPNSLQFLQGIFHGSEFSKYWSKKHLTGICKTLMSYVHCSRCVWLT